MVSQNLYNIGCRDFFIAIIHIRQPENERSEFY